MTLLEYLFSCKNRNNHKIIRILGLKLSFTKENFSYRLWKFNQIKKCKGAGIATRYYVEKYLYATQLAEKELNNLPQNEIDQLSGKFWTMWLQEDIPEIIQMTLATIKKFYPEIIIITDKNIHEYINVPDYILTKYKSGIIKPCHYSDYLRMCLLDKYGGTWLDSTCYMLDKIPQYITKEKFFIMQDINKSSISNFFIHSAKNNYITKTMKIYLEEYWKHENITIDYFFFHHFFMNLVKKDNKAKDIWTNLPICLNHNTWLIQKMANTNVDLDLLDYLLRTSFMYKINRKNKKALENPNSWYSFLLNKYRNGELLSSTNKSTASMC